MKIVAIFGAGVAGLSAAHEFSRLGYHVNVYETNPDAGGFFRSARRPENKLTPSEYSWHGFGPWYHNLFDIMKQIPFDDGSSVYEKSLSRPINYGIIPDKSAKQFNEKSLFDISQKLRLTWWDKVRWVQLLFKTWSSNQRSKKYYSRLIASEQWRPIMSDLGWRTWRATFGPWVGSDWTHASLHHVGQFFRRNLMSGPTHYHSADNDGPSWTQGSGDGWLLLRGPSNEFWFDRWVTHLKKNGVEFFWKNSLKKFAFDGKNITGAFMESGEKVQADIYVVATNPFAAADIFDQTPELAGLEQIRLLRPLVADGPHTQVSFQLAFADKIAWPRERSALLLSDSEFNLTLFAVEQVWDPAVSLGEGARTLWTGTACVATVPGSVYSVPLVNCTKEQFIEEVKAQLLRCEGLDFLLKKANNGRGLKDFPLLRIDVWHEWRFSPEGIKPNQPKWVMSAHTQPYLPTQATPVPNLVLAGAHTKTDADIWSVEGAVESGRRAVQVIEPSVNVIPQYKSKFLLALSAVDDLCFRLGLPHILDLFFAVFCLALILFAIAMSLK